ncbi:MAG: MAPEG family protein [Bradyrhizobiaceae bacterium]|nr:MAPEG family protein [Bradyrhizobiaceae bacterium]
MSVPAVLAPVFVLVALTFFLNYWMGYLRVTAVSRGEVHTRDIALRQPAWPKRTTQIGNAFHNQLEMPVLFYVLVAFALITQKAGLLFVVLSWLFVALRFVHAYIMVTSNRVSRRFWVFFVASLVLLLMWIVFAVQILSAI